jgi:uncharacterized protein (DUF427 family)
MPKATWNNAVIAEAPDDDVQIVEGNVYFPLTAVKAEYLTPSQTVTQCSWKGSANYYNVSVGGQVNKDAAWTYRGRARRLSVRQGDDALDCGQYLISSGARAPNSFRP